MQTQDYFSGSRYVKELTPKDFDSMHTHNLKTIKNGIILFYAPWCGYCKAVAPTWEEAAKISGFCDFYAFNCEKYKAHLSKIKESMPEMVTSYPTIITYQNGQPKEFFNEERTVEKIVAACMRTCINGRCK
jgi:thiol-disulfide isomerase/thioredoxin